MRVTIDKSLCAGCGTCVVICPQVFEMQDDLAVNIIGEDQDIPGDYETMCEDASDSCPVEAIVIER
ncbi:MAG TPA: ferredoxin [Syntrophorhabdaceae bacterium]|nr:ferredoxin [Syntrophorhabdaceae bacterium]